MASRRSRRVRIGDVFQIPLDDERTGYGQVVAKRMSAYLVILFKAADPAEGTLELSSIINGKIAGMAETLDSKLWNGDWPVVGNTPPDWSRICLPNYKVAYGGPDNMHVEAYDGKRHRPATRREIEMLRFREVCSAMRVQKAFQAFHGAIPWNDNYAAVLDPEYCRRSAEISLSRLAFPGWKNLWRRLTSRATQPTGTTDDLTLGQLKLAGANLGKPTEVVNHVYFEDEQNANRARTELQKIGYTVGGPSKSSQGLLLTVKREMIPTRSNIAAMRRAMETVAKQFHGDYDGWEAAVTT